MPNNFTIDENLLQQAKNLTNLYDKQTIELALIQLIQYLSQQKIRELRGKLHWKGDLIEMRKIGFEGNHD